MSEETYLASPEDCRVAAVRLLEQALAAALNEEWDHAHYYAGDARIWLEGCND